VAKIGGYLVQGATANDAQRLLDDALAVQDAGAVMIVLEKMPDRVAARISRRLRIPTIGIGAGAGCDGQVLVLHDMLGIFDRFTPKFVKRYAEVMKEMERGLNEYREEVEQRRFPTCDHAFPIEDAEWAAWAGGRDGSGAADEESAWHGQLIGC
jgi:3-methyl-2-oxobutanoate hydroxymethyltransferase